MLLQLPCRSLSSSPARSHLWFKPSLLLHWHSWLLVEKNIYTPVSLQNSPSSSHCKFMIANLKRALGAVQKSSLSLPDLECLFSHSAKWPCHTSSYFLNALHRHHFLYTLRCLLILRVENRNWSQGTPSSHLRICYSAAFVLTSFAFLPVALWGVSLLLSEATAHPSCSGSRSSQPPEESCSCIRPEKSRLSLMCALPPYWVGSFVHQHTLKSFILSKIFPLYSHPLFLFSFKAKFLERVYYRWCYISHLPSNLHSTTHWTRSHSTMAVGQAHPVSSPFCSIRRSLPFSPRKLDPLGFLHTTCRCFCLASWSLLRFLGGLLLVWPIDKLGVLFLCDHFLSLGNFIHSTCGNDIFGPVSPKSASPGLTASLRPNP